MTTIAYRDGVMVADKKMSYHSSTVSKIFRIASGEHKGWLFGGSGGYIDVLKMKDWIEGVGEEPQALDPNNSPFNILLVDLEGNINAYFSSTFPIQIEEKWFSIGSGSEYAMGAMAMGATAEQAIGVAETYDMNTGNGLDVLFLNPPPEAE